MGRFHTQVIGIDVGGDTSNMDIEDFKISKKLKLKKSKKYTAVYHIYENVSIYVKLMHGHLVLHNETAPAYVHINNGITKSVFFLDGFNVKIEDLLCDDHTKCMLLLKHTYEGVISDMHVYV